MYSAITLRRRIEKFGADNGIKLKFSLKNVRVNGVLLGCIGHITDTSTGICVYVTTDVGSYAPNVGRAMYRLSKNGRDFSSNSLENGYNRWCKVESLPHCVINLIKNERNLDNVDVSASCGY